MLWILFFLWTHTEKATGSARVRVECAMCRTRFSYRITRTGTASETFFGPVSRRVKEQVYEEAEEDLEDLLEEDFDCVPCPGCGDYQPEMAERLKREHYARLLVSRTTLVVCAVLGLLGCIIFGLAAVKNYERESESYMTLVLVLTTLSAIMTVCSLGTWLGTRLLYTRWTSAYDPNNPEQRRERLADAREWTAVIVGKPLPVRARLVDE